MTKGGALFFRTLATYLNHFAGRIGHAGHRVRPDGHRLAAHQGEAHDRDRPRTATACGSRRRACPPVDGVVYFENDDTIGIRADDAIYRFLRGFRGPVMACHHIFADISAESVEQAWPAWLNAEDLT